MQVYYVYRRLSPAKAKIFVAILLYKDSIKVPAQQDCHYIITVAIEFR